MTTPLAGSHSGPGLNDRLAAPLCDAHLHFFGPRASYPLVDTASYDPAVVTSEEYAAAIAPLDVRRIVLVQPSVYGSDHRCLLDSIRSYGIGRARGVAMASADLDDIQLLEWSAQGIRALRVIGFPDGVTAHQRLSLDSIPSAFISRLGDRIGHAASLAARHSMHLDLLIPGAALLALRDQLAELPVDFTAGHLGLVEPRTDSAELEALVDLVGRGSRRCWPKLTAPYRIEPDGRLDRVQEIVSTLVELSPDRLIWGSDFPHAQFGDSCRTIEVASMTLGWIDDPELRRMATWENPSRLYGFDADSPRQAD